MTNEEQSLQHLKCINILYMIEQNKRRIAEIKDADTIQKRYFMTTQQVEDSLQWQVGIGMRLYGWYKGNLKKLIEW